MKRPFENIVGKGENAGNRHFLLFPQCFQHYHRQKVIFLSTFMLSSANAFNLDQPKILWVGKELTHRPLTQIRRTFADSLGQDQTVQNVVSDPESTLSNKERFFSLINPLLDNNKILHSFKLLQMTISNLTKIQMGRNTVGKGEIAYYKQFLLFPLFLKKAFFLKGVIVWEWGKIITTLPPLPPWSIGPSVCPSVSTFFFSCAR